MRSAAKVHQDVEKMGDKPTIAERKQEAMFFKLNRAENDLGAVSINYKSTTITDKKMIRLIEAIGKTVGGLLQLVKR